MIMEIRVPENAEVADYISDICKTITVITERMTSPQSVKILTRWGVSLLEFLRRPRGYSLLPERPEDQILLAENLLVSYESLPF
jgi:hypothetical protein